MFNAKITITLSDDEGAEFHKSKIVSDDDFDTVKEDALELIFNNLPNWAEQVLEETTEDDLVKPKPTPAPKKPTARRARGKAAGKDA